MMGKEDEKVGLHSAKKSDRVCFVEVVEERVSPVGRWKRGQGGREGMTMMRCKKTGVEGEWMRVKGGLGSQGSRQERDAG